MTPEELKKRTKEFALRMLTVADSLPNKTSGLVKPKRLTPLPKEANELTAILAASRKTASSHRSNRQSAIQNRQSAP